MKFTPMLKRFSKLKFSLLIPLVLYVTVINAQIFRGTVYDKETAQPLPYTNIGVNGKNIGGISNEKGYFEINISQAAPDDIIVVSYLGYKHYTIATEAVNKDLVYRIDLEPNPLQLKEVVISGKKEAIIVGDNKKSSRYTGWGQNYSGIGRARGLVIEPKNFPLKATKFIMHINDNTFDSVKFRLNIFALNKDSTTSSLISENIFFTTYGSKKWVDVDISHFNIVIFQKIIVAVEWVDAWGDEKMPGEESHQLTLSLGKKDGYFYIRETPEEKVHLILSDYIPSMYFECFGIGK